MIASMPWCSSWNLSCAARTAPEDEVVDFRQAREHFEKQFLGRRLDQNDWNVSRTADKSSLYGYPGKSWKPMLEVAGNLIFVAWTDKYCHGGRPGYAITVCPDTARPTTSRTTALAVSISPTAIVSAAGVTSTQPSGCSTSASTNTENTNEMLGDALNCHVLG